ncbi:MULTISPECIES: hypothetical protein [Bacillus]|uniref:Uncharacterized protein n=1 Tax=Bacillus pumilus TaxID=1408 RepID=A0A9Q9T5E9_BACPU|nr:MULTISPECIES: hypothetical protein [Bacillus]MED4592398.1 hypothetical protein [Bacillus safensis]MED4639447.1 hypothetical protein [Bacillus safensis]VCT93308.1 hypothetical protein SBRMV_023 [Bacillus pumilus]VCT99217.1 hypothetical protein AIDNDMCJ_19260 [Bacillus safensis]
MNFLSYHYRVISEFNVPSQIIIQIYYDDPFLTCYEIISNHIYSLSYADYKLPELETAFASAKDARIKSASRLGEVKYEHDSWCGSVVIRSEEGEYPLLIINFDEFYQERENAEIAELICTTLRTNEVKPVGEIIWKDGSSTSLDLLRLTTPQRLMFNSPKKRQYEERERKIVVFSEHPIIDLNEFEHDIDILTDAQYINSLSDFIDRLTDDWDGVFPEIHVDQNIYELIKDEDPLALIGVKINIVESKLPRAYCAERFFVYNTKKPNVITSTTVLPGERYD